MTISNSQLSILGSSPRTTVTFPSWLEGSSACSFCFARAGTISIGRGTARHTLVFGGSDADPDHDAVIRIGVGLQPTGLTRGEAPRRRAHSLRRRASHACLGSPPTRTVLGIASSALPAARPISLGRLLHHSASRCPTQNHTFRNFPGCHQPPKGDKQLAGEGDNHGLAGAAAGIRRLPLIPLH